MSEFWLIVSIGHTATKWLSMALDSRPDVTAYHELKMQTAKKSWGVAAKYEARNGAKSAQYRKYFKVLQEAETPIVVDANSWVPWIVPQVHEVMPINRVIYIVRHGISQLYSLGEKSDVWKNSDVEDYVYGGYLQPLYDFTNIGKAFNDLSKWERLCLLWASSIVGPNWLRKQGLPVQVTTFEELTQRDRLSSFLPDASDGELRGWKQQDINRKLEPGPRRPVDLWPRWSKEQQQSFIDICGPGMELYGYETPE